MAVVAHKSFSGRTARRSAGTMMLVPCYLGPSTIEGLGVYATVPIRRGQIIWRFDPRFDRLIPKADIASAPRHMRDFLERYTYDMPEYPDHVVLDADEGRFMNHADAPNCDFSEHHLGRALADIDTGTELTCDYRVLESRVLVFQGPRHKFGNGRVGHA
jgi:SET domain-containing protein